MEGQIGIMNLRSNLRLASSFGRRQAWVLSSMAEGMSTDTGLGADRAWRPLLWLLWLTCIATATGTFIYTYPSTLESVRQVMIWAHDLSGDLLIATAALYLALHLPRTWRMWKWVLSRWSGYLAVLIFAVAAGSGLYGQLVAWEPGDWIWRAHMIGSVAWVVLGSFHAAVGLRRRYRTAERDPGAGAR